MCPAILNPKLFDMMDTHPEEHTARTLTLIAKTLQNLANLVEFGAKEPFMIDMNEFIDGNRERMKQCISIISVSHKENDYRLYFVNINININIKLI